MNRSQYIDLMKARCAAYFDFEEDKSLKDQQFELYGKYSMMLGRTFLTQKDIIDQFEANEHLLFKGVDHLTNETLGAYIGYLQDLPDELVKLHKYHKSTYITLILVCDGWQEALDEQLIKKFKYEKVYSYYFKGFCEVRLIIVNLSNNQLLTNKAAKQIKKAYKPS